MSEKIVQLNEEVIKGQIKELVRGSVEETLNELLEAEAENLTQAARKKTLPMQQRVKVRRIWNKCQLNCSVRMCRAAVIRESCLAKIVPPMIRPP